MVLLLFILGLIVICIEALSKIAVPLFIIFLIVSVILVLVAAYEASKNKQKFLQIDMTRIDSMGGLEFEKYVGELLTNNGYSGVSVTQASGDYGVDVLAKKGGKSYAIQCKCYSSNLGIKAVQEIYSGAKMYHADIPVVITNSYFTPNAKRLASKLCVQLWDRNELKSLMEAAKCTQTQPSQSSPQKSQTLTTQVRKICEQPDSRTEKTIIKTPQRGFIGGDNVKGPIQKNQLPNGRYVIGKDIPVGVYDFEVLHGSGTVKKYISEETEKDNYWEGVDYGSKDDKRRYLINVDCKEGEVLEIPNNVVVSISRSNRVELDL